MRWPGVIGLLLVSAVCAAGVYHVDVSGNDRGTGSGEDPWQTWRKGFLSAGPGDTVYIHGGTYRAGSFFHLVELNGKSGEPGKPVSILNFPGESPVLDLSDLGTAGTYQFGIRLYDCAHWRLRGLTVAHVPKPVNGYCEGIAVRNCGDISLEQMTVHDCGGDGYVISELRGRVRVRNCDAWNCASTDGENGNGFTFSFSPDSMATLEATGCRAWHNLDDGFDCWDFNGLVTFDSCWAFDNGYGGGDGDGFKLGKISDGPHNRTVRILNYCLAVNNQYIGFDHNECTGVKEFYHCVALRNTYAGFASDNHLLDKFSHNIAHGNGTNWLNREAIHRNNSWDQPGNGISDAVLKDLKELDPAKLKEERKMDGCLPDVPIPAWEE
jgi:hypothetical protein